MEYSVSSDQHQESSSSQNLWSEFWKESSNRKRFFNVTELQRKAMVVKSKKWFLKCCDCFKVVPVTLSVNKQHQPGFTGEQETKWREAEIKSEQLFLSLAKEQIEMHGCELRTKMRRELIAFEEEVGDANLWRTVESELEKARIRAWKAANNDHRLKLQHLLVKNNKNIPAWLNKSAQTKTQFSSLFLSQNMSRESPPSSPGPIHSTPVRPQPQVQRPPVQPVPHPPVHPLPRPPVPPPGVRHNVHDLEQWHLRQRAAQRVEAAPRPSQPQQPRRRRKNRRFIARARFRNKGRRIRRRKIAPLVTNYSNYALTKNQNTFLNHGLNWCPLRRSFNKTEVIASILDFQRKMLWKEFWWRQKNEALESIPESDEEDNGEDENNNIGERIFKDTEQKTNFPRGHSPRAALKDCLAGVKTGILGAPLNKCQSNLAPQVEAAGKDLAQLQKDREIVIKPSDKTGGVCVLPFEAYDQSMRQKLDATFVAPDGSTKPKYVKITANDLAKQHQKIAALVEEGVARGFISVEDAKLMVPDKPTPGRLYGLVKDHKPVDPQTGIPPLREVISGSGSNTEYASAYVDFYLKPHKIKLETYLEDTPHFLRCVEKMNEEGPLPPNSIPVVVDIDAMFPSVPHEGGLQATSECMESDNSLAEGHGAFIVRLMEAVLEFNSFEYDEELYNQRDGCAIGTRAAPSYTGVFMGKFNKEVKAIWNSKNKEENRPKNLKLFEDDYIFFWTGGKIKLLEFLHFLNSHHPAIKIKWDFNFETRSVEFLDLRVWVDSEGFVQTDLYTKPNAKNNYLLPSSNHPSHIFKNIPYSLAHRLVRNCSQKETLEKRFAELKELLLDRNYRPNVIDAAIERARALDRGETLKKVEKCREEENRVRFIVTFDPRLPDLGKILKENHKVMLESDQRLKEAFPKPPMLCFRRPPNIKDLVCRAKLPPKGSRMTRSRKLGYRRCQKPTCRLCPYSGLEPGEVRQSVTIAHSGAVIPIKSVLDCQTKNLIYELHCKKDLIPYIGETSKTAENRTIGHLNTILQDCHSTTSTPVGQHFRSPGHSHTDLQLTPFEKIYSSNPFVRKAREAYLIDKHELLTKGLNRKL